MNYEPFLSSPIGDNADDHLDPAPSTRTLWLFLGAYAVLMAGVILLAIGSVKCPQ